MIISRFKGDKRFKRVGQDNELEKELMIVLEDPNQNVDITAILYDENSPRLMEGNKAYGINFSLSKSETLSLFKFLEEWMDVHAKKENTSKKEITKLTQQISKLESVNEHLSKQNMENAVKIQELEKEEKRLRYLAYKEGLKDGTLTTDDYESFNKLNEPVKP